MELCTICHLRKASYTCPACGTRTCSLPCVKQHKSDTNCSGTVDPAAYIPRKNLATDPTHTNRDYNFLQRQARSLEVGKRTQLAPGRKPRVINGVNVLQMPAKMGRAALNKSGYNGKKKKFFWTVEFIYVNEEGEKSSLKQVPDSHIVQEAAKLVCKEDADVFLKKVDLPVNEPGAIRLDLGKSLKEALAERTVIEFPTLYVVRKSVEPKFDIYTVDSDSDSSDSDDSDSSDDELIVKETQPIEARTEQDLEESDSAPEEEPLKSASSLQPKIDVEQGQI